MIGGNRYLILRIILFDFINMMVEINYVKTIIYMLFDLLIRNQ